MLSQDQYEALLEEIKKEFPDFLMIKKNDSKLMKTIDIFLKIMTFGKMNTFMEDFITTVGNTVYVNNTWDARSTSTKAITLRHERVHMRQSKSLGRIKFSLLYLLLPVPVAFAYYRKKFEQEAYEESLRALFEYYGPKFFTQSTKDNVVNHFTSAE